MAENNTQETNEPYDSDADTVLSDNGVESTCTLGNDETTSENVSQTVASCSEQSISQVSENTPTTRTLRQRRLTSETIQQTPSPKKRRVSGRHEQTPTNTNKDTDCMKSLNADDHESNSEKRRSHLPRRSGISWSPGSKLEAMDYLKKWYPAKIVSVDEDEQEVLIHFDGWNSRFDEWLDMRSDRLRAHAHSKGEVGATSETGSETSKSSALVHLPKLQVGHVVLAKWQSGNTRKYPAVVKAIKSKSMIDIEFYDGVETEVSTSLVQRLPSDLQQEAMEIWNTMTEVNNLEEKIEIVSATEDKPDSKKRKSRRETMEAKKLQQDKLDATELLLSKLIDKANKWMKNVSHSPAPSEKKSESVTSSPSEKVESSSKPKSGEKFLKEKSVSVKDDSDIGDSEVKSKLAETPTDSDVKSERSGRRRQSNASDIAKRGKTSVTQTPKQDSNSGKKKLGGRGGRKSERSAPTSPFAAADLTDDVNHQQSTSAEDQIITVTDENNTTSSDSKASSSLPLPVVELEKSDLTAFTKGTKKSLTEKESKHGSYTVELQPVNAVPAKAFIVEEDHNQFKCPFCNKGFRKETLLQSHVKHYHSGNDGPSGRRRRKTYSHCSSDSEMITPTSTPSSTPLTSPQMIRDVTITATAAVPVTSVSAPTLISTGKHVVVASSRDSRHSVQTAESNEMEYDAETDEEFGESSSYQSEIVNCICGYNEEDDLMIQCELCCCWQHAECFNLTPSELPDRYICFVCVDTPGCRDSAKYLYNQDWHRKGRLPKLDFMTSVSSDCSRREAIVKEGHNQMTRLQNSISSMESIKRLLESVQKEDRYELALWSPAEVLGDQSRTEQERVLLYVDQMETEIEKEMDEIEAKLTELEREAGVTYTGPEDLVKCKGTLQTLAKDITKVRKLAALAKTSQIPAAATTTASGSSISEPSSRQQTVGSLSASSSQSTLNPH